MWSNPRQSTKQQQQIHVTGQTKARLTASNVIEEQAQKIVKRITKIRKSQHKNVCIKSGSSANYMNRGLICLFIWSDYRENDYITIKLMSKNPLLFHFIFIVDAVEVVRVCMSPPVI